MNAGKDNEVLQPGHKDENGEEDRWYGVPVATCMAIAMGMARKACRRHGDWCDPSDYENLALEVLALSVAEYQDATQVGFIRYLKMKMRHDLIDYYRKAFGRTKGVDINKSSARSKAWGRYEQGGRLSAAEAWGARARRDPYTAVEARHDLERHWKALESNHARTLYAVAIQGESPKAYSKTRGWEENSASVITWEAKKTLRESMQRQRWGPKKTYTAKGT